MNKLTEETTRMLVHSSKAWSVFISQFSHALSTKIATLQLKQQGLQKVLPTLLKGYRLAVKNHLLDEEINEKMLSRVNNMIDLDEQIFPMFELLERLNTYSSLLSSAPSNESNNTSAQQCLTKIIESLSFEDEYKKDLLQLDTSNDLPLNDNCLFIESAIRHLLNAGLQRIIQTGNGTIKVWLSNEETYFVINIEDTTTALSTEQSTQLFSHFFYEPYDKSYPGLGFCRLALWHINGDIICTPIDAKGMLWQIKLKRGLEQNN